MTQRITSEQLDQLLYHEVLAQPSGSDGDSRSGRSSTADSASSSNQPRSLANAKSNSSTVSLNTTSTTTSGPGSGSGMDPTMNSSPTSPEKAHYEEAVTLVSHLKAMGSTIASPTLTRAERRRGGSGDVDDDSDDDGSGFLGVSSGGGGKQGRHHDSGGSDDDDDDGLSFESFASIFGELFDDDGVSIEVPQALRAQIATLRKTATRATAMQTQLGKQTVDMERALVDKVRAGAVMG